jgi:hypothetical protein
VEAAYYSAPPGRIGRQVQVQWDGKVVRLLDPKNGQLLREHLRGERGRHRIKKEDRRQRADSPSVSASRSLDRLLFCGAGPRLDLEVDRKPQRIPHVRNREHLQFIPQILQD